MRILITGAEGQLGKALVKKAPQGHKIIALSSDQCDVTNDQIVLMAFKEYVPETVIHCAAYTAVDKAEMEPDVCRAVNIGGSINVASACRKAGAKMVFLSTDYVFNGERNLPYETDDIPEPLNAYGRSKTMAEMQVRKLISSYFIVRTSWMFGNGNNFVKTILRLGNEKNEVSVVNDQVGSPTYSEDLAELLYDMVQTEKYGVYNATNEGFCSWADLAERTFRYMRMDTKVNRITSEEYPALAKRPKNSRLSKKCLDKNGFARLPPWQEALKRYLTDFEGML